MSVKKTASLLAAAAILSGAALAFAQDSSTLTPAQIVFQQQLASEAAADPGLVRNSRHGVLTMSELNTIMNFESEVNYRNFVSQLSAKYGVSPAAIERMADRQFAEEQRRFYRNYRRSLAR